MAAASDDPVVDRVRARLRDVDAAICEALARRVALVAELQSYKRTAGLPAVDSERERQIADELEAAAGDALSREGVHELVREVLALTKRELARRGQPID